MVSHEDELAYFHCNVIVTSVSYVMFYRLPNDNY